MSVTLLSYVLQCVELDINVKKIVIVDLSGMQTVRFVIVVRIAHSDESINLFKIVQNKLHYAAQGHTTAKVIYNRADAQ